MNIMLIICLGNPGKEYEKTRHNAGFWCADKLANLFHTKFISNKKYLGEIAAFTFNAETHFLLKPLTYMNNSGGSIDDTGSQINKSNDYLIDESENPSEEAILSESDIKTSSKNKPVLKDDDINLPVGRVRLRAKGSAGGHNGLKSIISKIGENFWRLRIGVGLPNIQAGKNNEHEALISHVLGKISSQEAQILNKVIEIVPDLVKDWLNGEGLIAMNKYNNKEFE